MPDRVCSRPTSSELHRSRVVYERVPGCFFAMAVYLILRSVRSGYNYVCTRPSLCSCVACPQKYWASPEESRGKKRATPVEKVDETKGGGNYKKPSSKGKTEIHGTRGKRVNSRLFAWRSSPPLPCKNSASQMIARAFTALLSYVGLQACTSIHSYIYTVLLRQGACCWG